MTITRERMHHATLMAVDAFLITASFVLALKLANRDITDIHYRWFEYLWMLAVLLSIKLFVFYQTGLYREIIRYASMEFAVKIVKATVFGSLVAITLIHIVRREIAMPVLVVDWMASCILVGLSRFGMRYVMEGRLNRIQCHRFC
jgi:FlaA1/EpsC-like NDP-sugar epimerase